VFELELELGKDPVLVKKERSQLVQRSFVQVGAAWKVQQTLGGGRADAHALQGYGLVYYSIEWLGVRVRGLLLCSQNSPCLGPSLKDVNCSSRAWRNPTEAKPSDPPPSDPPPPEWRSSRGAASRAPVTARRQNCRSGSYTPSRDSKTLFSNPFFYFFEKKVIQA
jgi:hypothetical protein